MSRKPSSLNPARRPRFPRLLALALALLATPASPAPRAAAAGDEPKVGAVIISITVNKVPKTEAQPPDVTVTRVPGCVGAGDGIKKNARLCVGDRVTTGDDVTLQLSLGGLEDVEKGNEVTVYEKSEVTISSIRCGLCRWFASLTGRYSMPREPVQLSNTGTVYEVNSMARDDSFELIVYEGEVQVEPLAEGQQPPAPGGGNAAPMSFSVASKQTAFIRPDGTLDSRQDLDKTGFCTRLVDSANAEIAAHRGNPPDVAVNVAKAVNTDLESRRDSEFIGTRCESLWAPDKPAYHAKLGKIYNDWGNGKKALTALNRAMAEYSKNVENSRDPGWQPGDDFLLDQAVAYLLVGQPKDAQGLTDSLLAKSDSPVRAKALNVRGAVYLTQAVQAKDVEKNLERAEELLNKARADLAEAERATPSDQVYVPMANLGQLLKARGDLARDRGNDQEAEDSYQAAIGKLAAARKKLRNENVKVEWQFTRQAIADAYLALAPVQLRLGKADKAIESFDNAAGTYKTALANNPNFWAASCGLANLHQLEAARREAADDPEKEKYKDFARTQYKKCIALNPATLAREVVVPDVVGKSKADALQILTDALLEPRIDDNPGGERVEKQEPAAGKPVRAGEKVELDLNEPARRPPLNAPGQVRPVDP